MKLLELYMLLAYSGQECFNILNGYRSPCNPGLQGGFFANSYSSRLGLRRAMDKPTLSMPVGELVRVQLSRARILERLGIDYCCGGKMPLSEACHAKGHDPQRVLDELLRADQEDAQAAKGNMLNPDSMSLTALADHIEQVHHAFLRAELPRIEGLTAKVAEVHRNSDSRLPGIFNVFCGLRSELEDHMLKEEQVLFPMIRQLESEPGHQAFHCGSIANPIRQMEFEHANAGQALEILRKDTDNYRPPQWACNTMLTWLEALHDLEQDLHIHIHKENNVLFPRAIALETDR